MFSKLRYITVIRLRHLPTYLGWLLIAIVLIWLGFKASRIYITYRNLTPHLANLQALAATRPANLNDLDLEQIEADLQGAATGFDILSKESGFFLPLTPYLGWVPTYGGDIQSAPYLLAAGRDLSKAGVILFDSFSPALRSDLGQEQGELLPHAISLLTQTEADLEQAEMLLKRAEANINLVDADHLSPKTANRVTPLKQHLPKAVLGVQLMRELPVLLGAESPQAYLVITQNADEIRPSGGYINTAGHIIIENGEIVEFIMQDSYAVDQLSEAYPYPPEPIYQYMAADYWVLRDAGWSPDFPTTARTAMELYEMGQDVSTKGVIALDQHALPLLLRAFEPVIVDGYEVTSGNIIPLMREQWAPDDDKAFKEWWLQRKSFMLELAQAMRQRLEQQPDTVKMDILAKSLIQALDQKHILVHMEEPAVTEFLLTQNWNGSLQPVEGDYLMSVDANLGFNKASVIVTKDVQYQVSLNTDGSATSQVFLNYYHPVKHRSEDCNQEPRYDPLYEQIIERCYWNYPRLIVPKDSILINGPNNRVEAKYLLRGQPSSNQIDVEPIGSGKISWGQLFLLAPQDNIVIDYSYTLPPDTSKFKEDHWEYNLYLQKQAGTLAPSFEVSVQLPTGAKLLHSKPTPTTQKETQLTYKLALRTDQELNISYELP